MKYSVCVIICAAGKGARTGFAQNKLLIPLDGPCALEKALDAFDFPAIDEIIVTAPKEDFEKIEAICSYHERTSVVLGGETRTQSVYLALQEAKSDIVLVHDGARAFVKRESIEGCIESVKAYGSGVCAIPCTDTIAIACEGKIKSVPDRSALYALQTPQGFFRENLLFAYEQALQTEETFTDDSSIFARYCGAPRLCAGARDNIKLTYAEDFTAIPRQGFGVDTHAFGKEQDYILLAGVKIPAKSGLIAHSDGDVLVHALMDALLSAAGLKDIGFYFPDTDEQWKNADSMKLLDSVVGLLANEGYTPNNVSIAIQAETPRLAPYIDEMKNRLSSRLFLDPSEVGITAGTNEGLGYVGEGKGITVYAVATIKQKR